MRLTATFNIALHTAIVFRGDGRPRTYSTTVDGFDVQLTIVPKDPGGRSKLKGERLWTYMSEELTIAVSRSEADSPPDIGVSARGGRDFTTRVPYFSARLPSYASAASKVCRNAIAFLRFQLRQPLARALTDLNAALLNAEWTDELGGKIDSGIHFLAAGLGPRRDVFGIRALTRKHDKLFGASLAIGKSPSLHLEILSDAQAAVLEGNVRRAVLELAVACEVFAKHTFYGASSGAALVFEALEDRGKTHVRVLELIDIGGDALYGNSFRVFDRNAYTDIEHLFRARNKVAHRGIAVFRDEKGQLQTVDAKRLKRWWQSVEKLFAWPPK